MENSRFFLKLWRFNAVVIALVGVFAVIAMLITLGLFAKQFLVTTTRTVVRDDVVNTSQTEEVKENFQLGNPHPVLGTDLVKFSLYSEQNFRLTSYKGKHANALRNIAFFNTVTEENRWLFPTNDYLIHSHSLYTESGEQKTLVGYLYTVVKADTNGDERLTPNDKTVIAVSNPDGSDYRELITGVIGNIGQEDADKNRLYLTYTKADKNHITTLDLNNLTLRKTSVLPEMIE